MNRPSLGSTFELDRQSDRRADAAYLTALIEAPGTRFIVLLNGRPVLDTPGSGVPVAIRWFCAATLEALGVDLASSVFLGLDKRDGTAVFVVACNVRRQAVIASPDGKMSADTDLRELATQGALPEPELALIGLAKALCHWHDTARCCGRCGGTTKLLDGGWKRRCRACGREYFPRLDPVVIMLAIHPAGDRCLLAHEHRFRPNMFSALAGYIEPGEDIEHAVRREVLEETRIRIGEVSFLSSQPWPFPHTLMLGCLAAATSEEIVPDAIEIAEARWFSKAEAVAMLEGRHPDGLFVPGRQAIAHTLIRHFAEGQGQ